jgi:hypothetical protein
MPGRANFQMAFGGLRPSRQDSPFGEAPRSSFGGGDLLRFRGAGPARTPRARVGSTTPGEQTGFPVRFGRGRVGRPRREFQPTPVLGGANPSNQGFGVVPFGGQVIEPAGLVPGGAQAAGRLGALGQMGGIRGLLLSLLMRRLQGA